MYKFLKAFGWLLAVLSASGCEMQKSANPLSPAVAGPIPGVNIATPRLASPANGARVASTQQPITLTVENATTNGVRPLSYVFEVATDAEFAKRVFEKRGVTPGTGRTSVTLPTLESDKTYYWRSLAQDGANAGTYGPVGSFVLFTPAVVEVPKPVSPVAGATVSSLTPTLTFENAARSGPVAKVTYLVTVNTAPTLPVQSALGFWWQAEQAGGNTSFVVPAGLLTAGKQYYWSVMSTDGTVGFNYSRVESFMTPVAPAGPPANPGGGAGGGAGGGTGGGTGGGVPPSSGVDGIDLSRAVFHGVNVSSWAPTVTVSAVEFAPGASNGVRLHFNRQQANSRWPDVVVWQPGGTIQWTLFACVRPNGTQWQCAGMHEFWSNKRGAPREWTGAPLLESAGNGRNNWQANWAYDARWGDMRFYTPAAGHEIAFFMVAGAVRPGSSDHRSVAERSNVVRVRLAASGIAQPF